MKFETPRIHIAKFKAENVLTASAPTDDEKLMLTNEAASAKLTSKGISLSNIVDFTF